MSPRLALILTLFFSVPLVAAQPLVPGYERLHDNPLEAGMVLFHELKCLPCHETETPFPIKKKTPTLLGLNKRVRPDYLRTFLADPQGVHPGTPMPNLFDRWVESDRDEAIEKILHFLYSLPDEERESLSVQRSNPSLAQGEDLFHTIGCVACHEPGREAEPLLEDEFGEEMEDDIVSEVTAPIETVAPIPLPDLKKKTWLESLADFLLDPYRVRPSGRMPHLKLSGEEAMSIAFYLLDGKTAMPHPPFPVDPQAAAEGKRIFHEMGCTNCHSSAGEKEEYSLKAPALFSLTLDSTTGCLASTPPKGVPDFHLDTDQRHALRAAMGHLQSKPGTLSATRAVRFTLASLNCLACHPRNGNGGPDAQRNLYFTGEWGNEMGEEGRLPPSLSGVGDKLTKEWLTRILFGQGGEVRPYLNTRMPHYEVLQLGELISLFRQADRDPHPPKIDTSGILHHHRNHFGRQLVGTEGLSCITCHNLKGHRSLGMPAVDLAVVPKRLRPTWFKKNLLNPTAMRPNTRMPAFFSNGKSTYTKVFNGNADQQIEAIWIYLKEIDQSRLPVGMEKTDAYVLTPEERPIVHRTFMKEVGPRAIAVGFPEGVHYAFDAGRCRVRLLWKGKFIDAESAQADRFSPFVSPLGEAVKTYDSPDDPSSPSLPRRFLGYRLDKKGVPTLMYRMGEQTMEETWTPLPDGSGFERKVQEEGTSSESTREEVRW